MTLEGRISELVSAIASQFNLTRPETGDLLYSLRTSKTGWRLLVGASIGPTGSGADVEGPELENYFELLKNIYPNQGTELWSAGDIVFEPDGRGRALVGLDDMGGTPAQRVTVAGSGINGTEVGRSGGAETHTLIISEIPSHTHGITDEIARNQAGTSNARWRAIASDVRQSAPAGGDDPHNNMPPSLMCNTFVKL